MSLLTHSLHRAMKPDRFKRLDLLLLQEKKSQNDLLQEQSLSLSKLIDLARTKTTFYSEKFRFVTKDNEGKYDMTSLPILRKEDIIKNRESMLISDIERDALFQGKTGGSTGKPVAFYYDINSIETMLAGSYRSYTWAGWQPGDRVLHFWGAKQDLKGGSVIKSKISSWITSESTIGVYEYTEENLRQWVDNILKYRPVIIQGYASILAKLSKFISDSNIFIPCNIKAVFSTAEVLYDWQRKAIEKAFSCKVFNQYGSREIPNIACECSLGNFHTFTDMAYVESVIDGDESKLIVTSLSNYVMPFIRYEIGDLGRLKEGQCECGSPFPMLEMGLCRSNDIIVTRTGKNVYPSYFIHLLDGINGVEQFQFIQENYTRIVLNITMAKDTLAQDFEHIKDRIKHEIDSGMELTVNKVDVINRTMSGKYRYVINNISSSSKLD